MDAEFICQVKGTVDQIQRDRPEKQCLLLISIENMTSVVTADEKILSAVETKFSKSIGGSVQCTAGRYADNVVHSQKPVQGIHILWAEGFVRIQERFIDISKEDHTI